tara:strand:+ start:10029 stop:11240 length:1212 start_codon:yes stop_codon:yes gene_type:complete
MNQQLYNLNQLDELIRSGLISIPVDNTLTSKPKIYYNPENIINFSGGLCMEGKVIKLGNSFYIDFRRRQIGGRIAHDELGRRFWSKEHAEQCLNKIRAEVTNGTFNVEKYKKLDVKEWKFEVRFQKYMDAGVNKEKTPFAPSSKLQIKSHYDKYFYPYFKSWDLRVISNIHISDFYDQLPTSLADSTKKNLIISLRSFYNMFDELDQTKIKWPSPKIAKKKIQWIGQEEQLKIISCIPEKHRPIFYFMIWHGVRPGEARALMWDCIDLKQNIIYIKRNWSERVLTDITKGRTDRTTPIYSQFKPLLKELARSKKEFVFTTPRGKNYGRRKINVLWNDAVEKAGYVPIRLYNGTKHSFASQLRKAGADLSDIQELLGHAHMDSTKRYADIEQTRLTRVIELKRR